ncbi:tyrosine-protein kinase STYK1b isoform X1 [Brienomyrus brachyistius]|uniref:tyrosine-protein kinase STYK1b isoform X1 n=2 Tax=Brienomyrus brachyistius TaxID=42636 RepID=UPI0020B281AA|nr:tyrosine-protein kinase STYK1b isoform X1 [Brienomyrus brachyistius]
MGMASYNAGYQCQYGDSLCMIRVYEQEVIVVPIVLLMSFLVTLIFLLLLRFCPEKVNRQQRHSHTNGLQRQRSRRERQGIDAPIGLNPLEHETIALDGPTYSTFILPPQSDPTPQPVLPELPRQRLPESFNKISTLPFTFSLNADECVSLYRARMDDRDVVLRVLNDSASASERQNFQGFTSFLWQLGSHPFLPAVLGTVTLRAPLITVVEELTNRDLLGFLWRCRQDNVSHEAPCDLTEKRIFTMATQVASALDHLHKKGVVHGNLGARSVLVGRDMTVKLWGLGTAYKKTQGIPPPNTNGIKKWQAPEVLARRSASTHSDIWSFGILLYEMVTLGDAPFADVAVNELLQQLQRGRTLKRPAHCPSSLYSIMKACCQWKEQDRPSLAELSRKLQSGEKSANDRAVLRVPEPINIERYLQEAGYAEDNSYSVL